MKSWQGYSYRFLGELFSLRLSILEAALLTALVLMCLVSAVESMAGRNIGNHEQIRMAKLQAQQELMALRSTDSN